MKKRITIRVDEDVLEWFKSQGKGYQSEINMVLRDYYNGKIEVANAVSKIREVWSDPDAILKYMGDTIYAEGTDDFFKPMPKNGKKP